MTPLRPPSPSSMARQSRDAVHTALVLDVLKRVQKMQRPGAEDREAEHAGQPSGQAHAGENGAMAASATSPPGTLSEGERQQEPGRELHRGRGHDQRSARSAPSGEAARKRR